MVLVKAFRGWRPQKNLVDKVACAPYDVLSSEEAKALVTTNRDSFLYVIKPEIGLPESETADSEKVYRAGKENLQRLIDNRILIQETQEAIYIYRLTWRGQSQTGFILLSAIDDYLAGRIKKHEYTRPTKEEDRTRLIDSQNAQVGPVFLAYRATPELDAMLGQGINGAPEYDFAADETRHQLWVVNSGDLIGKIIAEFAGINSTYIADGHHRSAAAAKVCLNRRRKDPNYTGEESHNYFLSVVFPDNQLRILPYNRVVSDLNGKTTEQFLEMVKGRFEISAASDRRIIELETENKIGIYLDGKWYLISFGEGSYVSNDSIERLAIDILTRNLLEPILGIRDPRNDPRIDFIGGVRGNEELTRLVDSGQYAVAFSLPPVSLSSLFEVADSGRMMPPKSTWFEPKLRSGLVVYLL